MANAKSIAFISLLPESEAEQRRARLNQTGPGVVVAPSIWWRKLAAGGENANAVTGQALTDLGRAATFYDCLVEVAPAHARDRQPL